MSKNSGPFLIHCGDGVERTGIVCAVLEAFMGASAEEITADYMKSYENVYHLERGSDEWRSISAIPEDILLVITGGRAPDRIDLRAAAEAYLLDAGLSAEEIASLREKLGG
jgi:hypothetical protein